MAQKPKVYTVWFTKTDRIEVDVRCFGDEEIQRAIDGQLDRGFDDWFFGEGEWQSEGFCEHKNQSMQNEPPDLQGIDRSDPDMWLIVPIRNDVPPPEESDEERARREFLEAEAAGQLRLCVEA